MRSPPMLRKTTCKKLNVEAVWKELIVELAGRKTNPTNKQTKMGCKGRRQNSQQNLAESCQILLVTLQKPASC